MLLEPFTNTTSMGDHEALARYGNKMTKPTRVLLAEADTISAQLLSFSLKRENFEVVHVRSGNDALHMAREHHFDLVLAEVQLPNVDGLELCRQLRTGWNTRNLPIVLITTLGSTEERIAGLSSGADDYVLKPYDVRELIMRLNRLVTIYAGCNHVHTCTRLPGSSVIESYIKRTVARDTPWAVLHIDINHFGAYNKIYGFDAGDTVLEKTADILREVVLECADEPCFVGHEGNDDFIVVIHCDRLEDVSRRLVQAFDSLLPQFYRSEGGEHAYQIRLDRQGNAHIEPRISLSIGALTSELCQGLSYLEMRDAGYDVVNRARREETSSVYVNRRHLAGRARNSVRPNGGAHLS